MEHDPDVWSRFSTHRGLLVADDEDHLFPYFAALRQQKLPWKKASFLNGVGLDGVGGKVAACHYFCLFAFSLVFVFLRFFCVFFFSSLFWHCRRTRTNYFNLGNFALTPSAPTQCKIPAKTLFGPLGQFLFFREYGGSDRFP